MIVAREHLLAWIRQPDRDPAFLENESGEAGHIRHGQIVEQFLASIVSSGFGYEVVNHGNEIDPKFEVYWTYRGATFVGFKQPPYAATPDDALLLGCSALLKNDWCRQRLPS